MPGKLNIHPFIDGKWVITEDGKIIKDSMSKEDAEKLTKEIFGFDLASLKLDDEYFKHEEEQARKAYRQRISNRHYRNVASGLGQYLNQCSYQEYLDHPNWWDCSQWARRAAGYRCQRCNGPGQVTHHLTYERRGYELPEDLIVLCRKCHEKEHGGKQ